MNFRLAYLYLIFTFGFASSFFTSLSELNLTLADYYVGEEFVAPRYLERFSQHLNDLEIEYLEFFTQLRPVKEAPVVLSSCLTPGGSNKAKRGPFSKFGRKLKGFLKHVEKQLFGEPPAKPIFQKFCAATRLTINVYYHVVTSSDSNFKFVTEAMIKDQTNYMNKFYAHLDINFVTQDLVYRIDADFATSKYNPSHPHRRFSRSGTYADLNVWITEKIPGDKEGESTVGYATFPDATLSAEERSYDGVVVIYSILPDGPEGDGSTLVHETGHWLGLRHTFDETQEDVTECVAKPDTDLVQDTLQFPAHRPEVFQDMQIPCGGRTPVSQYNFMSVSGVHIGFSVISNFGSTPTYRDRMGLDSPLDKKPGSSLDI
ncbi:hypothetical protein AA0117_g12335 [Alternaria alternata]|uniref:Peptidase M43 pregnancy-associated plasma-A domain-containing protein n=2 Tax=Alternaria alternata complex TaxID=187734 RepID=A0A4Q4N0R7_ALTAL|nr:hypothetical protein AA0115_g12035 [Alternaria tenuissima]RYN35557.1 hypothetical protein AA0114_g11759 [Alternaria tenuissima]RYN64934.1 hypothetical protein AA0117_g12335 [Alternaria alternata]